MVQLLPADLANWLADDSRSKPVLIDVREPWEFERCNIDESLPMPMATVPQRLQELDPQAETVLICHHGARSFNNGGGGL